MGLKLIMISKYNLFLDDLRIPTDVTWANIPVDQHYSLVRSYKEFVDLITLRGVPMYVCYDHDLADCDNIKEMTGYDCAKWLVEHFYDKNPDWISLGRLQKKTVGFNFPTVYTHSANPIGSANILGYINNFLMNEAQPQTCIRVEIKHTV